MRKQELRPFYILALSQKNVRFFSCTADSIQEKPLGRKAPLNLKQSERFLELRKEFQAHAVPSASKPGFMTHGHGGGREDAKLRVREFLEDVGDALEKILKKENAPPLILAMVEYEASIFRQVSGYPHIHPAIIPGNPDLLSPNRLHARALALLRRKAELRH